MRMSTLAAGLAATGFVAAAPFDMKTQALHKRVLKARQDANPWVGKTLLANPAWGEKLESAYETFTAAGDAVNAGKVRTIQGLGTFYWVSNIASLPIIDQAIADARAAKEATGEDQIIGLVLYNLPDRDCSAGESAGELSSADGGMARYKAEFVDPYFEKVSAATDVTFAIVLEPDSLANLVTNMAIEFCAQAEPVYKEGIAYAISKLQLDNVHLYLDAAHGGWLGWEDNLAPTAELFAEVLALAKEQSGAEAKVRGVSTNVSNYNPYNAIVRENYTEWNPSWDESNYASSLGPHLEENGVPAHFIVDQGRVALPGAREEWGEWCNVAPSGFGRVPGPPGGNNTYVDAIAWIKPGGESDGRCGYENAPAAGAWHPEFVLQLVENADESIQPASI
jgi:cellulose 1,4-beta-cellobiosidase